MARAPVSKTTCRYTDTSALIPLSLVSLSFSRERPELNPT